MQNLTKQEKKELRKEEWRENVKKDQYLKLIKKISIWSILLIFLTGSFWLLIIQSGTSQTTEQPLTKALNLKSINQSDISTGSKNAKVTIIEYADFQCPGCGAEYPIIKQLMRDYAKTVYFSYRFFPLTQIHKNAFPAAQAAYAAHLQGKFWEMHDMLFDTQKDWSESDTASDIFATYATKIGLNMDKFEKDRNSDSTKKFINNQENDGTKAGVMGTPTFFINGNKINLDHLPSYDEFKKLIQDIAKK